MKMKSMTPPHAECTEAANMDVTPEDYETNIQDFVQCSDETKDTVQGNDKQNNENIREESVCKSNIDMITSQDDQDSVLRGEDTQLESQTFTVAVKLSDYQSQGFSEVKIDLDDDPNIEVLDLLDEIADFFTENCDKNKGDDIVNVKLEDNNSSPITIIEETSEEPDADQATQLKLEETDREKIKSPVSTHVSSHGGEEGIHATPETANDKDQNMDLASDGFLNYSSLLSGAKKEEIKQETSNDTDKERDNSNVADSEKDTSSFIKRMKFHHSSSFDMLDDTEDNSEFIVKQRPEEMGDSVIYLTGDEHVPVIDNTDVKVDANVDYKEGGGKKLMKISFSKTNRSVVKSKKPRFTETIETYIGETHANVDTQGVQLETHEKKNLNDIKQESNKCEGNSEEIIISGDKEEKANKDESQDPNTNNIKETIEGMSAENKPPSDVIVIDDDEPTESTFTVRRVVVNKKRPVKVKPRVKVDSVEHGDGYNDDDHRSTGWLTARQQSKVDDQYYDLTDDYYDRESERGSESGWLSAKRSTHSRRRSRSSSGEEDHYAARKRARNRQKRKNKKKNEKAKREKETLLNSTPDLFQRYRKSINVNLRQPNSTSEQPTSTTSTVTQSYWPPVPPAPGMPPLPPFPFMPPFPFAPPFPAPASQAYSAQTQTSTTASTGPKYSSSATSLMSVPQPSFVPPPVGIPPPAILPSLPTGVPPPTWVPPPTAVPPPTGVPPPAVCMAPSITLTGVPPPKGVPPPTGLFSVKKTSTYTGTTSVSSRATVSSRSRKTSTVTTVSTSQPKIKRERERSRWSESTSEKSSSSSSSSQQPETTAVRDNDYYHDDQTGYAAGDDGFYDQQTDSTAWQEPGYDQNTNSAWQEESYDEHSQHDDGRRDSDSYYSGHADDNYTNYDEDSQYYDDPADRDRYCDDTYGVHYDDHEEDPYAGMPPHHPSDPYDQEWVDYFRDCKYRKVRPTGQDRQSTYDDGQTGYGCPTLYCQRPPPVTCGCQAPPQISRARQVPPPAAHARQAPPLVTRVGQAPPPVARAQHAPPHPGQCPPRPAGRPFSHAPRSARGARHAQSQVRPPSQTVRPASNLVLTQLGLSLTQLLTQLGRGPKQ